jgi:hypothetical protein
MLNLTNTDTFLTKFSINLISRRNVQPNTLYTGIQVKIYVKYTTADKTAFLAGPFSVEIRHSGSIKIRIWENHPGFAALPKTLFFEEEKKTVSNDEPLTLANV